MKADVTVQQPRAGIVGGPGDDGVAVVSVITG